MLLSLHISITGPKMLLILTGSQKTTAVCKVLCVWMAQWLQSSFIERPFHCTAGSSKEFLSNHWRFFNEHCFSAFTGSFWRIHKCLFFGITFLCSISLCVGFKCHLSLEYYHVFEGCWVHGLCFVHKLCVWQWNFCDRLWNHQKNFIWNACLPASS